MDERPVAAFQNGRYTIGPEIGEGAFAKVYRGTDTTTRNKVAIKLVRADVGAIEFEIMKDIQPGSSPYVEYLLLNLAGGPFPPDHFIVVMPLMKTSLCEFFENKDNNLTSEHQRQMCFEMLLALHILHESGIVHTDVKPDNILISPCETTISKKKDGKTELVDPHFKLCDFNSARKLGGPDEVFSGLAQTSNYRSPEVALKLPWNSKIDIFSLGTVLAECIHGDLILYPDEKEPDNPKIPDICQLLEQIEYLVGPIPGSMIEACPDKELVAAYKKPRNIYDPSKRQLEPTWMYEYCPDDPVYSEVVAIATIMLMPLPLHRPDAATMLKTCFREMLTEFNGMGTAAPRAKRRARSSSSRERDAKDEDLSDWEEEDDEAMDMPEANEEIAAPEEIRAQIKEEMEAEEGMAEANEEMEDIPEAILPQTNEEVKAETNEEIAMKEEERDYEENQENISEKNR